MNFLSLIIITSFLWGIGQVLVKKGLSYLSPWHSYALDTLSAVLLWVPYGLLVGVNFSSLNTRSIILALFIGIIYAFYYYVIEKGPISVISPIFSTAPVFTAIFSYYLLKEILAPVQIIAIVITVFGVILLSLPHSKEHLKHVSTWIVLTILLTFAFSFETIASKYVIDANGNGAFMLLFAFGQIAAVLIWYLIRPPKKIFPKIHHTFFLPSLLGVFMFNTGTITWALALEQGLASIVAVLSNAYLVVLVIFSAMYLKEKMIKRQYVGIALVILGVAIVNIYQGSSFGDNPNKLAVNSNSAAVSTPTPIREKAHVSFVIDGDTFVLSSGPRVRLIGIDAPEDTKYSPVQCFGAQSKKMLTTLIGNQEIELEKDTSEKDSYNRLLRYVYQDGILINNLLVKEGFARVLTILPDTRYRAQFLASLEDAKAHNRGLWNVCNNGS